MIVDTDTHIMLPDAFDYIERLFDQKIRVHQSFLAAKPHGPYVGMSCRKSSGGRGVPSPFSAARS